MVKPAAKRPLSKRATAKTAKRAKSEEAQSSLERMLGLLDLFTTSAPVRPVTDLVNYLGTSRSTSYRYIKALHAAGLLEAVANGRYVLGPRIVEFDRQIRMTDPLYQGGGAVLRDLVDATGYSALLCALNRDSVMCIREDLAKGAPPTLFSRGQRRPLFFGAASKIILPYVPPHRLIRIFEHHHRDIAKAGLGTNWQGFRDNLAAIRRDGYCVSYGEFNPGVFGVAAAVFNSDGARGRLRRRRRFCREARPQEAAQVRRRHGRSRKATDRVSGRRSQRPRASASRLRLGIGAQ